MSEQGENNTTSQARPESFWRESKKGEQKPASTTLNPEFISLLERAAPGTYLDIGTGDARVIPEVPAKHHVVGVDINQQELVKASEKDIENASFLRAAAERLPFPDSSADGILLLGVLSTVEPGRREQMLREVERVLKEKGLLYVAEFTLIDDPKARTGRDNKLWSDVYRDDLSETGEFGTVVVRNADGSPRFHAHHFAQEELEQLFKKHHVSVDKCEKVTVISQVSKKARDTWNIWGNKLEGGEVEVNSRTHG